MAFNFALHGVRGMAAILVLLFHSASPFPGLVQFLSDVPVFGARWDLSFLVRTGWIGVDWFFVLSGFVLAGTLWAKSLSPGEVLRFWWRRSVRIFPALWLQLLTLVPLLYALGLMASIDWAQVFGNAVLWLRPLPWGYRSLNGVYWTLVVEFSFYLLLPWLLMLLRRTHILLLLALVVGAQLLGQFGRALVPHVEYLYQFLRYVFPFLAGLQVAFIAGVSLHLLAKPWPERQRQMLLAVLVLVYLAMLWGLNHFHSAIPRGHWSPLVWRMVMALIIAAILWTLLAPMRGTGWLASRPMVWLGDISYGIYLWHLPVQTVTAKLWPDMWTTPLASVGGLLLTTVVTLLLASVSYHAVERPLMRRFSGKRQMVVSPARPAPPDALVARPAK